MINYGGGTGQVTQFNAGYQRTPYTHSGKHTLKVAGGATVLATVPKLLFVALSDRGNIDVLEVSTGRRVRTIGVPGVRVLSCYWRQ